MSPIYVTMLGEFSLTAGETSLSDAGNRSKKVWALLAYLLCNRGHFFSQQKLIDLLWGNESDSANPENVLRITLHRLRAILDQLWEGAGRELIVRREGGYGWNPHVAVELDCETMETLAAAEGPGRLDSILQALDLYRGDFLPRQASEMWIIPISTHFQNLHLTLTLEAAKLLSEAGRHSEAARRCSAAADRNPYHEPLHQLLMQTLVAAGDRKAAGLVYESLSKRLFDDFGIRPNDQTREIYRSAVHSPEDRTLPMDEVLEHLQEPDSKLGAMICDYDYFKVLCYAESRAMERSGNATHIALLSLASGSDKPLTKRSINRIMEQLGDTLRTNLRRGDTISRCSVSQYILMLPKANYEDSCMVCRRLIAAFNRSHPYVTAKINFMVQPLHPSICVP